MGNFKQTKKFFLKNNILLIGGKDIIWGKKKKYCFRISWLAAVFSHYMTIIISAAVIISLGCFKQKKKHFLK